MIRVNDGSWCLGQIRSANFGQADLFLLHDGPYPDNKVYSVYGVYSFCPKEREL
jgi:hypothetical protein